MDYESLKRIVLHHDSLYYDKASPILSDEEYDSLFEQLVSQEKMQGWRAPDSPSIRITAAAGKVKHPYPLYSLKKVYSEEEIDPLFTLSTPKLDGVNLSVGYSDNAINFMATRGDGEFGENVLHLSRVIKGIPVMCSTPSSIVFVGEVVTDNEVENFRNYVAGALGLKSAKTAKDRNLRFIVHDVLGLEEDYLSRLEFANRHNFDTVLSVDVDKYPQDGVVYRVAKRNLEINMGHTSKYPKFAVALKKKEHYSAATHLQNIDWIIGRSGVVTPVGVIEPVVLDDATITRVILHNYDFVVENDLRPGDLILIERRITPQFVRVLEHSNYEPYNLDDVRRSLDCEIHKKGPRLYVDESDGFRLVEHYVKALGIKGIGPNSIRKMDITHPSQLYNRSDWDFLGKNGEKIEAELREDKDYASVLSAVGIPGVGKTTAKLIVSHIPKFDDLPLIAKTYIKGIGPKTVEKIISWYDVNHAWVKNLPYKLEATAAKSEDENSRVVVITGKLDMTKSQLREHLEKYGYTVKDNLTKDCYILITAGSATSKVKQAEKYGIPVINYWENKSRILKGLF